MSVRLANRTISSIQFIDDARKIVDIITDRCLILLNRISKTNLNAKYIANEIFSYYKNKPIRLANDAYLKICIANRIFVKDKKSLMRRVNAFKSAIENYYLLSNLIGIIYNKFSFSFTANSLANITDLIQNEIKQLENIVKINKQKYNF